MILFKLIKIVWLIVKSKIFWNVKSLILGKSIFNFEFLLFRLNVNFILRLLFLNESHICQQSCLIWTFSKILTCFDSTYFFQCIFTFLSFIIWRWLIYFIFFAYLTCLIMSFFSFDFICFLIINNYLGIIWNGIIFKSKRDNFCYSSGNSFVLFKFWKNFLIFIFILNIFFVRLWYIWLQNLGYLAFVINGFVLFRLICIILKT